MVEFQGVTQSRRPLGNLQAKDSIIMKTSRFITGF